MESFVHLLITRHRAVWRVRILIHGDPRIRWRAYRVAEYPTPEVVVRRCAAGLSRRGEDERHDDNDADGNQKISQHGLPLRVRWEYWERLSET